MYIPEYTITNRILGSIATIEYLRAVAETKVILPSWQRKLKKEAKVKFFKDNLNMLGIKTDLEQIKKYIDGLQENPAELVDNISKSLNQVKILAQTSEIEEEDVKNLYASLTGNNLSQKNKLQIYRNRQITGKTDPEELLAEMVRFLDWLNSLDGKETHPLIRASIIKARIINLMPFKNYNELMSNLLAAQILKASRYDIKGYCRLEMAYAGDPAGYRKVRETLTTKASNINNPEEEDLTTWIDFYLERMASDAAKKKEEILLLAKDTKIAAVTGRSKLSKRQEKIVSYLQDYGIIQNKDFEKLFPNISEDTVLRELKKLIKKDIVVKKGRTKSSRYELQ